MITNYATVQAADVGTDQLLLVTGTGQPPKGTKMPIFVVSACKHIDVLTRAQILAVVALQSYICTYCRCLYVHVSICNHLPSILS